MQFGHTYTDIVCVCVRGGNVMYAVDVSIWVLMPPSRLGVDSVSDRSSSRVS